MAMFTATMAGEYEIALNVVGDQFIEIAGTLEYGQTITGVLELSSQMGWTFAGLAEDVVNITLVPASADRDLVLVLMDPAGNMAITVDAVLNGLPEQLVDFELIADGDWTIVVREFFNEGSDFELSLARPE